MRPTYRVLLFAAAVALAYLGWTLASRRAVHRALRPSQDAEMARRLADFERIYGGSAVRILQFYSPTGNLMEGDHTTICYGVVNARSARIEPPVDGVKASLNRCVQVAPEEATRYTLVVEGHDGSVVSESFVIQTHPDPYTLPNIKSFRIMRALNDRGRPVFLLSFAAENAEEIEIDPPVFPTLHGAPHGTFYVAPERTTSYTLTAIGKKGRKVQQQLTVEAPPKG